MQSWLNRLGNQASAFRAFGRVNTPDGNGSYRADPVGAAPPLSEAELQAGQEITCASEYLVHEIQRILRVAKDQQSLQGGDSWAGTAELLDLLAGHASVERFHHTTASAFQAVGGQKAQHDRPRDPLKSLEQSTNHPQFVSYCIDTSLAPNLGHCLRLMRVIELEAARDMPTQEALYQEEDEGRDGNVEGPDHTQPQTAAVTTRITTLLVKLCQEPAVAEQMRHHLEGLFRLTTSSYPRNGLHIQIAAQKVVAALSKHSLSASLVWFIHDRQIISQMVEEVVEMCAMSGAMDESTNGRALREAKARNHEDADLLTERLLTGQDAERAGMWLIALRALVELVCHGCPHSAALLSDLQDAGGYDLFKYMVHHSAFERRPDVFSALASLIGAGADPMADRRANKEDATLGQAARNISAFQLYRDVLIDCTPILAQVQRVKQGVDSRVTASPRSAQTVPRNLALVAEQATQWLQEQGDSEPTTEDERREQIQLQLLNAVLQIYSNHPRNYAFLEPKYQMLSSFLSCLASFRNPDLRLLVIKTLEYVCSGVANCVPTHALYAAAYSFLAGAETFLSEPLQVIESGQSKAILKEVVQLVCATLEKLIQFDHLFVEVLSNTGVLGEVFYPLLSRAVNAKPASLREASQGDEGTLSGSAYVIGLTCRILVTMLHESPASSAHFFRSSHINQILYSAVGETDAYSTAAALHVLRLAALADTNELQDTLTCLIELLQSCRHERWRQLVVLKVIKDILTSSSAANDLWRLSCGFEAAVAALSSLDGAFRPASPTLNVDGSQPQPANLVRDVAGPSEPLDVVDESAHLNDVLRNANEQDICLELIQQLVKTVTIAISGKVLGNLRARVENRQYLMSEIGYDTLKCCLVNSKVLTQERYAQEVVQSIFTMVTEQHELKHAGATIKNADAVILLLNLLTELPRSVAGYTLRKLLQLISNGTYVATEQLCLAGALRQVVSRFGDILNDPDDPIYSQLLRLLYVSGRHRVTIPDLISMLRCLAKPLFFNQDGRIVLCSSFRRQVALHPELARRKKSALEAQWRSLLILAELAETSDSVPFLRLGGGRNDLLALAQKWSVEEPKEIGVMEVDSIYAATAYSEGMRFVMIPTVGGAAVPSNSSTGFSFSCWFRFGVEAGSFTVSSPESQVEEGSVAETISSPQSSKGVTQKILWLFTVSSPHLRSSLQVYLDRTHQSLCIESYVGKGLDTELIPVDLCPGEWHHLLLVHRRARNLLSNKNTFSVFVNGVELVESFKTDHFSFLDSPSSRCFIGVPIPDTLKVNGDVLRGAVSPIWHIGPILLISEALSTPQAASAIFAAGPAYIGSFQGERPVHNNAHALITSLLGRLHRMSPEIQSALLARGLHDLMKLDSRSRDDELLLTLLNLRIPLEQIVFSFHAGFASPCEITPRYLSSSSQNLDIYHEPCYRLVNSTTHISEEGRHQWGVVFGDGVLMNPLSISDSVFGIGGPQVLFPLIEVADSTVAICIVLELVRVLCKGHAASLDYMQVTGYRVMVFLLMRKRHLLSSDVLRTCFGLAVDAKCEGETPATAALPTPSRYTQGHKTAVFVESHTYRAPHLENSTSIILVDAPALRYLVLNWELWCNEQSRDSFILLLSLVNQLVAVSNPSASFNAHRLHDLGMVRWVLSVMMQTAKLSTRNSTGWSLPRMTMEDGQWGRQAAASDELLTECSRLLQRLLLCRLSETDVSDVAAVLLSTIAYRSPDTSDVHESCRPSTPQSTKTRSPTTLTSRVTFGSATIKAKDVILSPQSVVRVWLLEVLLRVIGKEHDHMRRTSVATAQGKLRKVIDFFAMDADKPIAAKVLASAATSREVVSMTQENRALMVRVLVKALPPGWFRAILTGCRDSLSVSLIVRILCTLLQEREELVTVFTEQDKDTGFAFLPTIIAQHHAAPIVLLPVVATLLGIPLHEVPLQADLTASRVFDILPLAADGQVPMSRPLFGALMTALTEALARNLASQHDTEDALLSERAIFCTEEVLFFLRTALEVSHVFLDMTKCKEFIKPLVLILFTCADLTERELVMKQLNRMNSAGGSAIPLNTSIREDYMGSKDPEPELDLPDTLSPLPAYLRPNRSEMSRRSDLEQPPYFAGAEAVKLLEILTIVLKDALYSPGTGSSCSVSALLHELLHAFPHTALELQIYAFQHIVLNLISDLTTEALSSGDVVPITNAVAISAVLLECSQGGIFPPSILNAALDACLNVTRELAGRRPSRTLGPEGQQQLLGEAVASSQALSIVALRRCVAQDQREADLVLNILNTQLTLLLNRARRPAIALPRQSDAPARATRGPWRRSLATTSGPETLMGPAGSDDNTMPSSTPVDLSKTMRDMKDLLRQDQAQSETSARFGPDKDDSFVTCLLAELEHFLFAEDSRSRRTAISICETLMQLRAGAMHDLLTPEMRDRRTKEKRVIDVHSKGFVLLQEPDPLLSTSTEDDTDPMDTYQKFDEWISTPDNAEEVRQVFWNIRERAYSLLPDGQVSTPEVLSEIQQAKVATYVNPVGQSSGRTYSEGKMSDVRHAFEYFLAFHNHIVRAGLSDIANGAVHWGRCLTSLRGVASVWEGTDLLAEKDEKWSFAPGQGDEMSKALHANLRWKLDMTEGPERMRKRLKRNFEFEEVFRVVQRVPTGATSALGSTSVETLVTHEPVTPKEGAMSTGNAFDLRETTKLLKQVAPLVRKNSGIPNPGALDDEDPLLSDEDDGPLEDDAPIPLELTDEGLETELGPLTSPSADSKRGRTPLAEVGRPARSHLSWGGSERAGVAVSEVAEYSGRKSPKRDDLGNAKGLFDAKVDCHEESSSRPRIQELDVREAAKDKPSRTGDSPVPVTPERHAHHAGVLEGKESDQLDSTPIDSAGRASINVPDLEMACTTGSLASLLDDAELDKSELVSSELISGFVDEGDGPVLGIYNVQRCTGLEVRPALFLYCRHGIVIVDGFAKVDSTESGSAGATVKRVSTSNGNQTPCVPNSQTQRFDVYLRESNRDDRTTSTVSSDSVTLGRQKTVDGWSGTMPAEEQMVSEDEQKIATIIGFDLEEPPNVEKMRFNRLKVLYKRRYQFRHVGVEFFDVEGRSFLVAFDSSSDQSQVIDLVLDRPVVNSIFVSEGSKIGTGKINYKRFMQHWKQQLTARWQAGRITNFEYLMHLNALAGRSFHDLTQYPVFPWILADFESAELNLDHPATFRDLSKPMGAIGESRAQQFRERFDQLTSLVDGLSPDEAEEEAPPFHYGTHYSCAGYVLHYLIRLEPYARFHLQLQGGKFDKPDRLFRDIKSSWDSASKDNLQDVRELTPEFFYLPDFLSNHNQFDFGSLQKGLSVNHVMLPPWAKGDAREFIRIHRMALESKYVSENLCHWVDLIFGYKQTGRDAIEAQNLFVHLTYEGVVDIDAITDNVVREATLAQITNFGQTPSRLFKRPHPARRVPAILQSNIESTISAASLQKTLDQSAMYLHQITTPALCIVGAPQHIAIKASSTSQIGPPYGGARPISEQAVGDVWLTKERALGVGVDCALVPPTLVKYVRYSCPDNGLTFRVAAPTTRHQYIDRVVSVHEQLHLGPVNCISIEENGEFAATGSKDSTLRVWSLLKQANQKSMSLQATLCGHTSEVLCCDAAAQLGLLVSGGADRLVIVWDLREATSLRLLLGHASPIMCVSINRRTGDIVTLAGVDLRMWSIAGDMLACVSAAAVVRDVPTCVAATSCPEWQDGVVAVTGHDTGKLCLWGLQGLPTIGTSRGGQTKQSELSSEGCDEGAAGECWELGSNRGVTQGRQLKVLQILQGVHTSAVTAIRVGREQRDLVTGDETGRVSKWSSVSLLQLNEKELTELMGRRFSQ